jgi:PAS domain S-box-containing protein
MKPSEATNLAQLLAATADGGFAIDAEGRILVWNHAAENMLGYTAREAVGRPCCDLLMGHDDNGNRLCCRGCYGRDLVRIRDQVHNFDMRTRTKAGSMIWVNVSMLMVSSDGIGDVTVHLLRDVTATREILALIRERLSTAAQLVAAAPDGQRCAHPARARDSAHHFDRPQHQGRRREASRQPGHRPQPRPEHPGQARRSQPARGGGLRDPAPPDLSPPPEAGSGGLGHRAAARLTLQHDAVATGHNLRRCSG